MSDRADAQTTAAASLASDDHLLDEVERAAQHEGLVAGVEVLRRLRKSAAPADGAREWQPIETAKEQCESGTPCLVYHADYGILVGMVRGEGHVSRI